MFTRIGLLCVPEFDADACAVIRRTLRECLPESALVMESSAASQRNLIEEILRRWCDDEELDLLLTIGGTLPAPGPSASEIVPEATLAVLDRQTPGLAEAMRSHACKISRLALLHRGVVGVRSRTLIANLPEGSGAAHLFLEAIVDVLPAVLAHLQASPTAPRLIDVFEDVFEKVSSDTDRPEKSPAPERQQLNHSRLNPQEFADFLQRRAKGAVKHT